MGSEQAGKTAAGIVVRKQGMWGIMEAVQYEGEKKGKLEGAAEE